MRWTILQQEDGTWAVVDEAGTVIVGGQATREHAVGQLQELAATAMGELPLGGVASGRGARFRMRYMEGEQTSDGRVIDPMATRFDRTPPLPIMLNTMTSEGHQGAQLSGVIDTAYRDSTMVICEGNFDAGSEAGVEHERLVREGILTTWSPDIGDAEIKMESLAEPGDGEEDDLLGLLLGLGPTLMHLVSGTLLGGTGVPFPALASAKIDLDEAAPGLAASLVAGGFPYARPTGTIEIIEAAVAASGEPCVDCEEQREAVVHELDEGLASGGVVPPGTYLVGEEPPETVLPPHPIPAGATALQIVAVGAGGGQGGGGANGQGGQGGGQGGGNQGVGGGNGRGYQFSQVIETQSFRPPAACFEDPQLAEPTPATVEGDRFFGHLAQWGVCHTGILDRCVLAPHSRSGYAYFMQGSVTCDGGERVRCGHLTIGCGHADLALSAGPARAHYDGGPGAVCAAHIAVGEDDHGIWLSGVVDPRLDDFQRWELETLAISGDWRVLGGSLELIAALSVPVPGFPILASGAQVALPQPELMFDHGELVSVVAAGTLAPRRVAMGLEMARLRQRVDRLEQLLEVRTEPLRASAAERYRARLRGE